MKRKKEIEHEIAHEAILKFIRSKGAVFPIAKWSASEALDRYEEEVVKAIDDYVIFVEEHEKSRFSDMKMCRTMASDLKKKLALGDEK